MNNSHYSVNNPTPILVGLSGYYQVHLTMYWMVEKGSKQQLPNTKQEELLYFLWLLANSNRDLRSKLVNNIIKFTHMVHLCNVWSSGRGWLLVTTYFDLQLHFHWIKRWYKNVGHNPVFFIYLLVKFIGYPFYHRVTQFPLSPTVTPLLPYNFMHNPKYWNIQMCIV